MRYYDFIVITHRIESRMPQTPDFRLTAVDSLEDFEAAMTSVHANRAGDVGVFATALDKRRGIFRDAAFLQLMLTWARLSPDAHIHLLSNTGEPAEKVMAEACGYSIGIAVIALAGGVMVDGTVVPRTSALVAATDRMEAAYQGRFDLLMKGRVVDLLIVSGAKRQYVKPLFSAPSPMAVRDKFDLKKTVRGLATRAAPIASNLDDATITALATLTHELVENMQEHAIQDVKGKAYRRHIELVGAGWLTFEESENDLTSNNSLRRYWALLAGAQPGDRKLAGICFSFLDSGPGMAARLLGKEFYEMEFEEERAALRECLRMRVTSKKEHGTGGGLQAVLTEVAQAHGFVRIRSGRQAIFRSFAPGDEAQDVCENFEDWYEHKSELLRVAGTLISVFIPLPRQAS